MHRGSYPVVFRNAAKLREAMTESEKLLWNYLRKKPLGFKFRRQHPLAGFILDFYCHELRISIEIDGGYHLKKEQKERDEARTDFLNDLGIREIRFTDEQVFDSIKEVIEEIETKLRVDSPLGVGGEPVNEKTK